MRELTAALQGVITELEASLGHLQALTVTEIFDTLGSYQGVRKKDLDTSILRNMSMAVESLKADQPPIPEDLDGAETTTRERFHSGVSIDQVILAFRMSFSKIHEHFIDIALTKLTAEELIRGSQILSGVSDSFTDRAVATFNRLQIQSAVADASRRASALRALLSGEMLSTAGHQVLPINASVSYAAIRAHIPEGENPEIIRRELERSGSTLGAVAVVVIEDDRDCVGLVSRRPKAIKNIIVGIGPFVPISESPISDQVATQALLLAVTLGRTGIQGVPELNWRLAAARAGGVDQLFRHRFLDPVLELGEFAPDLLETVHSWMRHGRSIPRTAQDQHVHVNTVRYRIARFSELTGFDGDSLDDVIGLAWVLEIPKPPLDPNL